jgi:pentatricopeptide repeat protein
VEAGRLGGTEGAPEKVFGSIASPDLVSWTSMLSGYTENGRDAEALVLFMEIPYMHVITGNIGSATNNL